MKRIVLVIFLLTGFTVHSGEGQKVLRAAENKAFKPGEVLKFRIHYGFVDAGMATLEVKDEVKTVGERPCYHIVGTGILPQFH